MSETGPRHERLERIRQAAIEAEFETGRREESVEKARDAIHVRLARITLGLILLVAGVVMLAVPGPGIVTIGFGLAILSRDFVWAERILERIKDRLPQDDDGDLDPKVIIVSVVSVVGAVAGSIWWYFIR
jgi:uncharacterized protein (TIGR02611 family)